MGIFERVRQTYIKIMTPVWVRKVYLVVGTTICLGIFYRPFIMSVMFPRSRMTEKELSYYDLENIYAVKKKKEDLIALQQPRNVAEVSNTPNETSTKQ